MSRRRAEDRWVKENQARLTARFERLHRKLAVVLGEPEPACTRSSAELAAPPALGELVRLFGLDPFGEELLVLLAAIELDGRVAGQVAALNGTPDAYLATPAAVFRALEGAHWTALGPGAPLRRWCLVDLEGAGRFTARTIRLEERVLHYLLGAPALEARLEPYLRPVAAPPHPRPSAAAEAALEAALEAPSFALVTGRDPAAARRALAAAAHAARRQAVRLDLAELPQAMGERSLFARLLVRETRLAALLPIVELTAADEAQLERLGTLLERLEAPVAVLAREPVTIPGVETVRVEVPGLAAPQRATLLRGALAGRVADGAVEIAAAQFDVPEAALRQAAAGAARAEPGRAAGEALWRALREQARPPLAELAERVEVRAGWDDLVLPDERLAILRQIADQVRHRLRVYDVWGFRNRLQARGLGITALFSGPSGTGKTLAAEVLAGALDLDLYRIDLSAVVSKYIGETEKNLKRIFDAAEAGGAVLLFDEADALFGKRSEVKDSHDRYANIEVGYLLQRMESYGGLAVLTTNMKQNMDAAFLRRLRFVVDFPFPGTVERTAMWDRAFPDAVPREGLEPRRLAQMNLTGGNIRNVALNAAFLAAADGGVVRPAHLLQAARSEYAKLEKPLTEGELRGWVEARR